MVLTTSKYSVKKPPGLTHIPDVIFLTAGTQDERLILYIPRWER